MAALPSLMLGSSSMLLYLAPLHGVTNKVYRGAYFRHFRGFDAAVAPFILAVRSSKAKPNHYKELLPGPLAEAARPGGAEAAPAPRLIPQLLGNEAEGFVETARVLAELGYREINWNLGCPYPMVAKKRRGSGLLPFPDRIAAVLDAACAVPGIEISVKLRLGYSDPAEILRLMPILNGYPLARVVLHPRLGTQMYRGEVDLDGFAAAAELCTHVLVYNGDIAGRASFERLRERFPRVDEWMLGRGAVADPFLAEEIATGAVAGDRIERLAAWHEDLYRSYSAALCGPGHLLDKMKELWSYLGPSFPGRRAQLERITRAKSLDAYEGAVAAAFARP